MPASGTKRTWRDVRHESAFGGKAENIYSERVFRLLTQTGHGSTNIPATTLSFNMVASIRGTVAIERHGRPSRTYAGKAWPNELPA
jgi:hypothetical protein